MRFVRFTKTNSTDEILIAPQAVVALEPQKNGTWIWVGDRTTCFCVKEDIATVINALYYKNDGGHSFTFKNGDPK